ncbi:MAG: hypothetical protein E7410_02945 [Ruminococcaceae bacterium]|nr:hypothetical protein [Oscillospiraceae bacterium]
MERAYQKTRTNTGSYARTRRYEEQKPLFSIKKLAVQTIASVIIFLFVYTMRFADTNFSDRVLNEALYTINYTVDLQSAYKSSIEIFDYLQGKIEQGKSYIDNTVLQVQNLGVQDVEDESISEIISPDVNEQSGEQ